MLRFIYITLHSDSDHSSIGFRYFSMKEQWKMRLILEKKKKRLGTTLSLSFDIKLNHDLGKDITREKWYGME